MKIIRYLLILLVFTGVYFAMSENGRNFFAKFFVDTNTYQYATVTKVLGKAYRIDIYKNTKTLISTNDHILRNEIIETEEKANVVLEFGDDYNCKVRLGQKTKIKFDELLFNVNKNQKSQNTISVIFGRIIVALTNPKHRAELTVKTKLNAMGIRGTTFSVVTDGINYSILGVKEGLIANENIQNKNSVNVAQDNLSVSTTDHANQTFEDKATLAGMNWDFEANNENEFNIEPENIIQTMNKTSATKHPNVVMAQEHIDLLSKELKLRSVDFDKELSDFKELESNVEKNKPIIANDINCINAKFYNCTVKSNKILLSLGFASTSGSASYHEHMVEELKKYLSGKIEEYEREKIRIDTTKKELDQQYVFIESLKVKLSTLMQNPENVPLMHEIVDARLKRSE